MLHNSQFYSFFSKSRENNDPNNVFATATAAFVQTFVDLPTNTHTRTRFSWFISTFYNEALLAGFFLLCVDFYEYLIMQEFFKNSSQNQPNGFFFLFLVPFAFDIIPYIQVHSSKFFFLGRIIPSVNSQFLLICNVKFVFQIDLKCMLLFQCY